MTKLSPRQFESEVADLKKKLLIQIEHACTGLSTDKVEKARRTGRAGADFAFFCTTYLPHYFPTDKRSLYQKHAMTTYAAIVASGKGRLVADAAPRGEAKSTIACVAIVLWAVVTARKRFMVIISESIDQAKLNLAAVQVELESNPRLALDFAKQTGMGSLWQSETLITKGQAMIKVAGALKRLRGWRFGTYRPDLIVLDDLENDTNVRSKQQRDQLERWIENAVLPMGPPDGSLVVIYVGTVLHYDSVLARKIRQPIWASKVFKAIVHWPDRMDLWEQWERVAKSNMAEASAFFLENEKELIKGAVVSWDLRPLQHLMLLRLGRHQAFEREYQNDPGMDDSAPFGNITIWRQLPAAPVYFGAVDPSLGKNRHTGDPSAILVGAFDRATTRLCTVIEDIARRPPNQIIDKVIAYHRQYTCLVWGVENTQFQEFFRQQLVEQGARAGVAIPARGLTPHGDKGLRIESLQPYVDNQQIQLANQDGELYKQLRYWPEADHDDGPDALQMLWILAVSSGGFVPKITSRPFDYAEAI